MRVVGPWSIKPCRQGHPTLTIATDPADQGRGQDPTVQPTVQATVESTLKPVQPPPCSRNCQPKVHRLRISLTNIVSGACGHRIQDEFFRSAALLRVRVSNAAAACLDRVVQNSQLNAHQVQLRASENAVRPSRATSLASPSLSSPR